MDNEALKGKLIINGADMWSRFRVFLAEEKRGGRENLAAIMTPSKVKGHVAVNIRENQGSNYSTQLDVRNEERDVTLHFAMVADSKSEWLARYRDFIKYLKSGWLDFGFPELGLTMRMFYVESSAYKPLTCLWQDGVHASRFKVKFREPVPSF